MTPFNFNNIAKALDEMNEKLEEDKKLDKEFSKLSPQAQTHALSLIHI